MKPFPNLGIAMTALMVIGSANASTAYGTTNNFDVVNDTGVECHGFEIEIEDCHSADITYTYNYNHYGTCRIIEDNSDPLHPLCTIRWASAKNPDGSWAAYTAIPSGPIDPTNGHQFTNPNVNFGGEHFGVGYRANPTAVRYHWLIEDGAGNLVKGPPVQVSTPSYTYVAPAGGAAGELQAAIEAPEPPEVHPLEFGEPTWVKEIVTTSHNNHQVRLRDLVSDDPDDENDINWKNGEPDEVETEWKLMQVEFSKLDGGANNQLDAKVVKLRDGDEVVTRRYEFYEYTGPLDDETGEAKAENVGPDGVHGEGIKTINDVEVDLSTIKIVGKYLGSQMSAFDPDAEVTLTEQLQDCTVGENYPYRTVVIGGMTPFTSTQTGDIPDGLSFDEITGIISGTPTTPGEFTFTVEAADQVVPSVSKSYTILVAAAGVELAPHAVVDTSVSPPATGTTSGDGSYGIGEVAMLTAVPTVGYQFLNWSDNGVVVSESPSYSLPVDINHTVVANFGPKTSFTRQADGSFVLSWTADSPDWLLEDSADPASPDWKTSTLGIQTVEGENRVSITPAPGSSRFYRLSHP